ARARSECQLLVALDRGRESEALPRTLSARLHGVAAAHGLPRTAFVGVATQTLWRQRSDCVCRQRRRCGRAGRAAALDRKHGRQVPHERRSRCRSSVWGPDSPGKLRASARDGGPPIQVARRNRNQGSPPAGTVGLRATLGGRWGICHRARAAGRAGVAKRRLGEDTRRQKKTRWQCRLSGGDAVAANPPQECGSFAVWTIAYL